MDPEIKIRGYHTDLYGHVNNARYLEFLEEGRWQVLEDSMDLKDFMGRGFLFFVVNINISYLSQAWVNNLVSVRSGLGKIGNKSAVIRQQVLNKTTGKICASADVTFVISDSGGKALKLEGELLEILRQVPDFEDGAAGE
ncbi:acyl-CoA thioesterase [Desulfospira joergensenii]|uniref:acyl-CoA thioesterase n=1 Tax=Desulfospira joergensenii TaxID=53329 RepID=UPI0003B74EE7|nr:thioesterase family protein [Desulfospira joergensenii]